MGCKRTNYMLNRGGVMEKLLNWGKNKTRDSCQLECEINLNKLFLTNNERENFNNKWEEFICSDECNKNIYEREQDNLVYKTEQIIPQKTNERRPLLLVLGNPASHSIQAGMFFAYEGNDKEHRFWRLLDQAQVLSLPNSNLTSHHDRNNYRKKQLLTLQYDSLFRIGLYVYMSMPSTASGKWSGVNGIHRLIGIKAMRRLEAAEFERFFNYVHGFLNPNGVVFVFQKNAWNCLRSPEDPEYSIDRAKIGHLKGHLKSTNIQLFGIPPTRLSKDAERVFNEFVSDLTVST